jgi:predicted amidohydrolase YtcJ
MVDAAILSPPLGAIPMLRRFLAAAVILFVAASLGRSDLVIRNARIWTGDPKQPIANWLVIQQGRVVAAGVGAYVGPDSGQILDLKDKFVVPGFYDSHIHMLGAGMGLSQVALKDAKDEAEFGKRLREFDQKTPRGRWLLGGDWDHDRALNGQLPTAALIDKYVPDRPVFIRRYDGHMGVINSKAMQIAGINVKTADPTGGVVYRNAEAKPTGLLRDNAMNLVEKVIPPPDDAAIAEGVRAALDELKANGITSAVDMDGSDSATRRKLFRLLQRMAREGKLTCRIDLRWPLGSWKELADLGVEANFGSEYLTIGGVKGFADGSLGSSTAKMFEPFDNEPGSTGVWVTPPGVMRLWVTAADKAGFSVAVHAIGDRANAEMLDIFGEAAKINGARDRRFRIEHAQHLRPEDCRRFKEFGVVASMQPYHIIDDGRWAEGRIGSKRCASSYANRSLLDAGATLAFGSDWPVAPVSAILGIDAAVNRRTLDGKYPGGWFPEQKITAEEALRAYTTGSAFAAFREKDRGMLTPGMLADFLVLSRDILDPKNRDRIDKTEVLMTVVGGKIVHEKK